MNHSKRTYFDTQADSEWATAEYGSEESQKIDRMLSVALIREGMSIVEPGCGTGRLTRILSDLVGPRGSVLALDISPGMIHACRRRLRDRNNVQIRWTGIEEFTLPMSSFDRVICHNVFPHFEEKSHAVEKLAAALKPGGRFIVFHFMDSDGINDLHRKGDPSVLHDMMPSREEMENLLSAARLTVDLLLDDDQGYLLAATKS